LASRARIDARANCSRCLVAASLLSLSACSDPAFADGDAASPPPACVLDCAVATGEAGLPGAPVVMSDWNGDGGSDAQGPSGQPNPSGDASVVMDADAISDDAGTAWAHRLEGSYVLRYRSFAREQTLGGLAVVASVQHWLATIALDDRGEVTLTTKLCEDRGELTIPVAKAFVRTSRPETQAPRTFRLLYEGGSFRTEGAPSWVGYQEAAPDGCAPGRKLPRRSDQPWLRSECDCPSSDLPPTSLTDCRLSDSDGDGQPGYTLELSGFVQGRDFCRLRDASQLVAGRIAEDGRHTATLMRNTEFFQLDCEGNGCARANGQACPGVMNEAEFVRLSPAVTDSEGACAEVMQQVNAGVYYSDNPLAVPPGCSDARQPLR
jgi:hypothetical protein